MPLGIKDTSESRVDSNSIQTEWWGIQGTKGKNRSDSLCKIRKLSARQKSYRKDFCSCEGTKHHSFPQNYLFHYRPALRNWDLRTRCRAPHSYQYDDYIIEAFTCTIHAGKLCSMPSPKDHVSLPLHLVETSPESQDHACYPRCSLKISVLWQVSATFWGGLRIEW